MPRLVCIQVRPVLAHVMGYRQQSCCSSMVEQLAVARLPVRHGSMRSSVHTSTVLDNLKAELRWAQHHKGEQCERRCANSVKMPCFCTLHQCCKAYTEPHSVEDGNVPHLQVQVKAQFQADSTTSLDLLVFKNLGVCFISHLHGSRY